MGFFNIYSEICLSSSARLCTYATWLQCLLKGMLGYCWTFLYPSIVWNDFCASGWAGIPGLRRCCKMCHQKVGGDEEHLAVDCSAQNLHDRALISLRAHKQKL